MPNHWILELKGRVSILFFASILSQHLLTVSSLCQSIYWINVNCYYWFNLYVEANRFGILLKCFVRIGTLFKNFDHEIAARFFNFRNRCFNNNKIENWITITFRCFFLALDIFCGEEYATPSSKQRFIDECYATLVIWLDWQSTTSSNYHSVSYHSTIYSIFNRWK